ncbi:hypothetical protein BCR43DRAFT_514289 [Syncephalastrum racemosum]|uniref:Uncharacterized protein n=1 Tax=Syncephalastrum racemosum TaxID=13706 RepID=A0A1X2HG63_SYNRA|nr:hypothetical protein BCR43DRAFT_514289 [Syncephalastrum racemosum]
MSVQNLATYQKMPPSPPGATPMDCRRTGSVRIRTISQNVGMPRKDNDTKKRHSLQQLQQQQQHRSGSAASCANVAASPRGQPAAPQSPPSSPRLLRRSSTTAALPLQKKETGFSSAEEDSDGSSTVVMEEENVSSLRNELEKERAVVKALQLQKEACNKDIAFLSQSVDELTAERLDWMAKYETQVAIQEQLKRDLTAAHNQLAQAREQISQFMADKDMFLEQRNSDGRQLQHAQNQVRVLKATMEQFLRMGIFSEDPAVYQDLAMQYETKCQASPLETVADQMMSSAPPSPSARATSPAEKASHDNQQNKLPRRQKERAMHHESKPKTRRTRKVIHEK